jgi:peptidoglycan/LPS O-acetylase OafA/YrhL
MFLSLARYGYSLGIAIVIFLIMVPVGPSKILERFFRLKAFYPFAQLIFPMYLFHFPFIILAAACVYMSTDRDVIVTIEVWQVFAIYALTVLFSMMFSLLAHVYIEKPCIILMDKRMERKKARV